MILPFGSFFVPRLLKLFVVDWLVLLLLLLNRFCVHSFACSIYNSLYFYCFDIYYYHEPAERKALPTLRIPSSKRPYTQTHTHTQCLSDSCAILWNRTIQFIHRTPFWVCIRRVAGAFIKIEDFGRFTRWNVMYCLVILTWSLLAERERECERAPVCLVHSRMHFRSRYSKAIGAIVYASFSAMPAVYGPSMVYFTYFLLQLISNLMPRWHAYRTKVHACLLLLYSLLLLLFFLLSVCLIVWLWHAIAILIVSFFCCCWGVTLYALFAYFSLFIPCLQNLNTRHRRKHAPVKLN